jgi:hypothetical protein
MTLLFTPLTGMTVIDTVLGSHMLPVLTAGGYKHATIDTLKAYTLGDIPARLTALEGAPPSGSDPSTPSIEQTLSLAGAVEGSVVLDASALITLNTTIPAGSLSFTHMAGLADWIAGVDTALGDHSAAIKANADALVIADGTLRNHSDRITALESAPAPVTDLTAVNTQLGDHETRLGLVEPRVLTLEGTAASHSNAVTSLTGRLDTAEPKIATLETTSGNHGTRLSAVETTNASQGTAISALQEADTTLGSRVGAVESVNGTQATAISALQDADTSLGNRLTTAEGEIDALQAADLDHATRLGALEAGGGGGSGGSGSANWTYVTAAATLTAGQSYLADATNGTFDLTLPTTPAPGDYFAVRAHGGVVGLLTNGNTIEGLTSGDDVALAAGDTLSLVCGPSNHFLVI